MSKKFFLNQRNNLDYIEHGGYTGQTNQTGNPFFPTPHSAASDKILRVDTHEEVERIAKENKLSKEKVEEILKKKRLAMENFKKHFPDAKDEKFLAVDGGDGNFSIEWKDLKNWEGATKAIFKNGDFLVERGSLSDELKKDLGKENTFPITLLLTEEDYGIRPTPYFVFTSQLQ